MKPRDWFGVGVRLAGLWCFVQSALNLMYFVDGRLGFARESPLSTHQSDSTLGYLVYTVGYAVLAFYFLFGAEHLTSCSFRDADATPMQEPEPGSLQEDQIARQ